MLPISLTLRNFLSYREAAPTLRLHEIHVACLCGSNGTGKSGLLDAITWALWGKARGQRHEQLLHHGQTDMSVELEFIVGQAQYRVARRYSIARKSAQSSLELAVHSGGDYRPISGGTIGETQADIIRRTSMDYETFVNSAFLVQGRADLFAMATATQRKEVLAKVLSLDIYDRLEERAKVRNREIQGVLAVTESRMESLATEIAHGETVRNLLADTDSEIQKIQAQAVGLQQKQNLIQQQLDRLEHLKIEASELEPQVEQSKERLRQDLDDVSELEQRILSWKGIQARTDAITQGHTALLEARNRLVILNSAAQSVAALQAELAPLVQTVVRAKVALEGEVRSLSHDLDSNLIPQAAILNELTTQLDALERDRLRADELSTEAESIRLQEQSWRTQVAKLEYDAQSITERGKSIREKLSFLSHEHDGDADCPLCGVALGPERRSNMERNYERDIEALLVQFSSNDTDSKRLTKQADEYAERFKTLNKQVEIERRRIDTEHSRILVEQGLAASAAKRLPDAVSLLEEKKHNLEVHLYAVPEQIKVASLQSQIQAAAFDPHVVKSTEEELSGLEHWDNEYQELTQIQTRLAEYELSLSRAQDRVSQSEADVLILTAKIEMMQQELTALESLRRQRSEIETELRETSSSRDFLQEQKGSIARQLAQIIDAETEANDLQEIRSRLVEDAGLYAELALAFGKGGIQALLIEASIPRLEDEANTFLKQMTDGRMSLRLETQRSRRTTGAAARSQETIETLDIVISDELGSRNYEMFSGGERFRVDFALRIALSKVLAWRSGAPLPTLFIDEGFGTQDADGRDRILDVIKAIEDRFERILVITHLEEVKEAFPVRIEVTRTIAGSTFSLS